MFRWLGKIIGLAGFITVGSVGIWVYQDQFSSRRKIEQLEEEKQVLKQVVQRLSDEKRVAEMLVTDQRRVDGVLNTTLLFVEYDKAGQSLPPRSVVVRGEKVHLDAMVIKFDQHFVSEGDPLRGHSIALFTRVYGDNQTPSEAAVLDQPGGVPDIYRGADPRISQFEQELWQSFWKLADDAQYRAERGVRIANGQGLWGPFDLEKLYTIALESDGGLNITSEPLKGIYREALKQRAGETH